MNGATQDGRKPVVSETVHDYGTKAATKEAPPQQSQVAASGASDPGTGKKIPPAPSKPNLAPSAEVQTSGTTAEEQAKSLAGKMYPSSRGLRRFGAG